MAVNFNGSNQYLQNTSFSWPISSGPVTVTFWNYAVSPAQDSYAFGVGGLSDPDRFSCHAPWGNDGLIWDYGPVGSGGRLSVSYSSYLDGWHHVALVSAGGGGSFKRIYVDGALIASSGSSTEPTVALTGIAVGRDPTTALYHKGRISDFRIYNRALSVQEIKEIHRSGMRDSVRRSLKLWAKMRGGATGTSPGSIVDSSGEGWDLTAVNSPTFFAPPPGAGASRRMVS